MDNGAHRAAGGLPAGYRSRSASLPALVISYFDRYRLSQPRRSTKASKAAKASSASSPIPSRANLPCGATVMPDEPKWASGAVTHHPSQSVGYGGDSRSDQNAALDGA